MTMLSMLSGKQVIIKGIRHDDESPGLRDHEVDLLKLIQKISNGTDININKPGTKVIFKPGIIDSGEGLPIEHKCDLGRSIAYYLECVIPDSSTTPIMEDHLRHAYSQLWMMHLFCIFAILA